MAWLTFEGQCCSMHHDKLLRICTELFYSFGHDSYLYEANRRH